MQPFTIGKAMLNEVFPETLIFGRDIRARDSFDTQRIKDELRLSAIEGATWAKISAEQARGTWDVLELISSPCLPIILPGYLQWLWDIEEADVMIDALPRLLGTILIEPLNPFSLAQLDGLSSFFSAILENSRLIFSEEEADLYSLTIQLLTSAIQRMDGKA